MRKHKAHSLFSAPSFLVLQHEATEANGKSLHFLIIPSPGESIGIRAQIYKMRGKKQKTKQSKTLVCSKVANYAASNASCHMDGINRDVRHSYTSVVSTAMMVATTKQHSGFELRYT